MPRRPNTKPTNIYWLIDTRPETIASGWPIGKPFYCGKTVGTIEHRLCQHKLKAANVPTRKLSVMLTVCGEHLRIQLMEIVPHTADWIARERHWIKILKFYVPNCGNISDGGEGIPGFVHRPESRVRMSLAKRNVTEETRAKLSAARKRRVTKAETREKMRRALLGRKFSPESIERMRLAQRGRKCSAATIEKLRQNALNMSDETREKLRLAQLGKKHSDETRAKMRESAERRRMHKALNGG